MPDTEEVKTKQTKSQETQKGAKNGLQETPDRGEVRREADVCGRLPESDTPKLWVCIIQYEVHDG